MALYERAGPALATLGEDIAPVADVLREAGINADAMRHFNVAVAAEMDFRPDLTRIDAPTLVIAGERDPFGGVTSEEIAESLPDPTVVTIEGADHFAFLEPGRRAPWSRAVLDFLSA